MTSKHDFSDQEWTRIRRGPLVAGVASSLADPRWADRAGQGDDGHLAVGEQVSAGEQRMLQQVRATLGMA